MITLINKKLANRKGFTLIELLVVLAVLAIIALIAIPNFIGIQDKAKIKSDFDSAESMRKSLDLYIAAEIKDPSSLTGTLITWNKSGFTDGTFKKVDLTNYLDTNALAQSNATIEFTYNATTKRVTHNAPDK